MRGEFAFTAHLFYFVSNGKRIKSAGRDHNGLDVRLGNDAERVGDSRAIRRAA